MQQLLKNQRYQAEITLAGLELLAPNDVVANKLREVGFSEVQVTGSGAKRTATGLWCGDTRRVEVPKQVTKIKKV